MVDTNPPDPTQSGVALPIPSQIDPVPTSYLQGGFLRPPPSQQTYAGPPDGYSGNAPYWRGPGGGIFPRTPSLAPQPPAPSAVSVNQASGAWRPPYIPVAPRGIGQIGGDWWPIGAAMNYPGSDPGPMLPSSFSR